jgi:hypothetical protein
MRKTTLTNHDASKHAAQYLLKKGLATYAEIATISGRSRQMARFWAQQLDAETAREMHLKKLWREALEQTRPKLRPGT